MLAYADRNLKAWHVAAACAAAATWFLAMMLAGHRALPGVSLARCPVGLCVTGYTLDDVRALLIAIGADGQHFLERTLLPLDTVLPALVLGAMVLVYIWFTRPGADGAVPLSPGTRYALMLAPASYCFTDYMENRAFGQLLAEFPNLSPELAHRASRLAAAKSQLIAVSIGIALALVVAGRLSRWRSGGNKRG